MLPSREEAVLLSAFGKLPRSVYPGLGFFVLGLGFWVRFRVLIRVSGLRQGGSA